MLVRDIMTSPAVSVGPETLLGDVALLMAEKNIGALVVVDAQGTLLGIITEGDFTGVTRAIPFNLKLAPVIFGARAATPAELEQVYAKARTLAARQVMTAPPVTAREDETVGMVVQRMLDKNLKHVPVVRNGKAVGMVARHDVMKAMIRV